MEPQQHNISRNELLRLQSEMKTFSSIQSEHAERLARLERRPEDDGRSKSIWGGSSPFPGLGASTPSAGKPAFKGFAAMMRANRGGRYNV